MKEFAILEVCSMRRFLTLLIFVLFLCFAGPSEARKLALLVGVDDYADVPRLHCCVNDMNTLKAALMKIGFEENDVQILTTGGDMPLKRKIEENVETLLSKASDKDADMIFIAFSGHGFHENGTDYFCPADANPKDISNTCVSISKVMKKLDKSQAKFKWMVVDACRSMTSRDAVSKAFVPIDHSPTSIALFQSCARGEESYEEQRVGGNGYFTKNLAAALSGAADMNSDGVLTFMDVVKWTTRQTQAEVRKALNKSQTPFLCGSTSDFTLKKNLNYESAWKQIKEARRASDLKDYRLAIEKYEAALALYPREDWIRELALVREIVKRNNPIPGPAPGPGPNPFPYDPRPGERAVWVANNIEYVFRWCPAGEFMMGSPLDEPGRVNNEKLHKVRITRGFWLLETEVTQEMWESVMGTNPSRWKDRQNPVENVSWDDCQKFCLRLGQRMGQQIKLPTEAQWEYACRAGSKAPYVGDLDSKCWNNGNSGSEPHNVKQKKPNAWNLYDMHGNVWEWCSDYYVKNYPLTQLNDPETISSSSMHRVIRGGGVNSDDKRCRAAFRSWHSPDYRDCVIGLRILLVPGQSPSTSSHKPENKTQVVTTHTQTVQTAQTPKTQENALAQQTRQTSQKHQSSSKTGLPWFQWRR